MTNIKYHYTTEAISLQRPRERSYFEPQNAKALHVGHTRLINSLLATDCAALHQHEPRGYHAVHRAWISRRVDGVLQLRAAVKERVQEFDDAVVIRGTVIVQDQDSDSIHVEATSFMAFSTMFL